jgi:hypothetical protein
MLTLRAIFDQAPNKSHDDVIASAGYITTALVAPRSSRMEMKAALTNWMLHRSWSGL